VSRGGLLLTSAEVLGASGCHDTGSHFRFCYAIAHSVLPPWTGLKTFGVRYLFCSAPLLGQKHFSVNASGNTSTDRNSEIIATKKISNPSRSFPLSSPRATSLRSRESRRPADSSAKAGSRRCRSGPGVVSLRRRQEELQPIRSKRRSSSAKFVSCC